VQHVHGIWGFFIASAVALNTSEVQAISMPENLQFLTPSHLWQAFIFDRGIATARHQLTINTLDSPQLFYYLLNPNASGSVQKLGVTVNFLDIQETGTGQIKLDNPFSIASVSQKWLDQMPQSLQIIQGNLPTNLDISQLLPVQHLDHSPQMSAEWLSSTQKLVGAVDISRLAQALEKRTKELPLDLRGDVQSFAVTAQKTKNPPLQLFGFESILVVTAVIILIANLASRDSGFGKGNTNTNTNNTITTGNNAPSPQTQSVGGLNVTKIFGSMLIIGGSIWLLKLLIEYFL
jgi:spermidine synthase